MLVLPPGASDARGRLCGLEVEPHSRSASACPAKVEERVVSGHVTLPSFEEEPCGKESERHAVSTVAEREPLAGISAMRADVGQAVGCHCEETPPGFESAAASDLIFLS